MADIVPTGPGASVAVCLSLHRRQDCMTTADMDGSSALQVGLLPHCGYLSCGWTHLSSSSWRWRYHSLLLWPSVWVHCLQWAKETGDWVVHVWFSFSPFIPQVEK